MAELSSKPYIWAELKFPNYKADRLLDTPQISENGTIRSFLTRAFEEDVRSGDMTTNAIVNESQEAEAVWIAKEKGIIAGLPVAKAAFRFLDADVMWNAAIDDGKLIEGGSEIVTIIGNARALLTAERIALNIAQRMSGIATMTRKFVDAIEGYPAEILDTRKTVPSLRHLDKYSVKMGGGTNHRMGLYDLAMIKDNHIVAAGSIATAVERVREENPEIKIEVETTDLAEVQEALAAEADIIMLDNMSTEQMKEAVKIIEGNAKTEASGNVTLDTVREIAATGVDYISVGALTHSVKAFDISQKLTYSNNH